MDAILTRTTDLPTAKAPDRQARGVKRLLKALSSMAHRAADRLTSPPRDVPQEFYRFPPF
jgi:hypothetical protein